GRRDQQVKVRGYRIELGEIESVLRQAEGIRECVVVAKEESGGEKRLVGYVKAEEGSRIDAAELKKAAKEKLPEYMVPAAIVEVEEYPLTPNGKIDRRALAARKDAQIETDEAYLAPQTSVEQTIARIWEELLHVEKVGRNHNFFDLGGHSLLLAKVHSRLKREFSKEISMTEMFKYPTVSALAAYVSGQESEKPSLVHSQDRANMRLQAMQRQVRSSQSN
ncbi:MAG TPA: phosphopantetheine-binding protein, partial [Terriglobales bacterium]|nr:phosphopantetheine-binding protein [Terriglobales bacterium]